MFPPSLHKNIRELDKQISLLESECENRETDKFKLRMFGKGCPKRKEHINQGKKTGKEIVRTPVPENAPRITDSALCKRASRPSTASKVCPKVHLNSATKKPSFINKQAPVDEFKCRKQFKNDLMCGYESSEMKKEKKVQVVTGCDCGKALVVNDHENRRDIFVNQKQNLDSDNEKQILHKGVLHANPGGTIEVTVTQKPTKATAGSVNGYAGKKSGILINGSEMIGADENDIPVPALSDKLRKSLKEQTWSQILCQEGVSVRDNTVRKNHINSDNKSSYLPNSNLMDKFDNVKSNTVFNTHLRIPNIQLNNYESEVFGEQWNEENECPKSAVSSAQSSYGQKTQFKRKNLENVIDASPRSECCGEKYYHQSEDDTGKSCNSAESFDPIQVLCNLVNALKKNMTENESKRLLNDVETNVKKQNHDPEEDKPSVREKLDECETKSEKSDYTSELQKQFLDTKTLCQRLMVERDKLNEDLALKDKLLSNGSKKEKEYLSIISNLKSNLEKEKEDNIQARKEIDSMETKLKCETKVLESLKESYCKMQEQIQQCMLENDKLKTEIRLNNLESQKFHVLLAGKDAEIKRYKDEVESFQRQITQQLATLRANNAANEVQKAMEAIIQQSHAFSLTDLDSAFSEGQADDKYPSSSRRQHEKFAHSSPTSSNSSTVNSSWNCISSIHADEGNKAVPVSREEVRFAKTNNNDDENDIANVGSFVSCRSIDLTIQNEDCECDCDGDCGCPEECQNRGRTQAQDKGEKDIRKEIKQLFADLKTKREWKLNSVSCSSLTSDDFLNLAESSNFSDVSCESFSKNLQKKWKRKKP